MRWASYAVRQIVGQAQRWTIAVVEPAGIELTLRWSVEDERPSTLLLASTTDTHKVCALSIQVLPGDDICRDLYRRAIPRQESALYYNNVIDQKERDAFG